MGGGAGGGTRWRHGRSRMTEDRRFPTMPGRNTLGFHRAGRHRVHRTRIAEREGKWGAYSCVVCLSRLSIRHASLSSWNFFAIPTRDTHLQYSIWALKTCFHVQHRTLDTCSVEAHVIFCGGCYLSYLYLSLKMCY